MNFIVIFTVIASDQILKWIIRKYDWFYVINPGSAFSFGSQWPWFEWVVWGTFLALIWYFYSRKMPRHVPMAWALLISGGASNLIDRIFFSGVIDYIKIWQFPIFNLADVLITLGVVLIIVPWFKTTALRQ